MFREPSTWGGCSTRSAALELVNAPVRMSYFPALKLRALLLPVLLLLIARTSARTPSGRIYNTTAGPVKGVVNVHLLCHS